MFVLEGFGTSALGLLLLLLLYDLEECNRRLAFGEEEEYVALSRFFIAVLEFGDFVVGELGKHDERWDGVISEVMTS